MPAKTGQPVRFGDRLDGKEPPHEIQEPAAGALLVVCSDCGFEWDASHQVQDDAGRVGYECPRCVLQAFVAARHEVIERTVREGAQTLARTFRVEVARLRAVALAALDVALAPRLDNGGRLLGDGLDSRLRQALRRAGFDPEAQAEVQPLRTPGKVASAIAFARETWRRDGAEGETVHLLCDELEALIGLPGDER